MEVKGTGVITTRDFVKSRFLSQYDQWLTSLPLQSKEIYKGLVMNAGWYNINDAYLVPMDAIAKMFFHGDLSKTGEELGRFSAEVALTGIYKAFILVATPSYLMKKASSMMSTFYKPCEIIAQESGPNRVTITIVKLNPISKVFEYRVAGWCKRALELSKCKNVSYNIKKQLSLGQGATEIEFIWS